MDEKCCRCCREPNYVYQILDKNRRAIECRVLSTNTDDGSNLIEFVLDLNDIQLSDEEKNLILELIIYRINNGWSVSKINKCLKLYEKISGKKIE